VNNKIVNNIIGWIVPITVFVLLISSFIKSIQSIKRGNMLLEKNRQNLTKIWEENKKLEQQLEILKSDFYIEKQLRDKLGLAKEGEIILVLPEPEIVKKLAPKLPEPVVVKPKPNWQKWLEIFR
jgi:cell division protein FtsB